MFKYIPFDIQQQYCILTKYGFVIKSACDFFNMFLSREHVMQWINAPVSRQHKLDFQFLT